MDNPFEAQTLEQLYWRASGLDEAGRQRMLEALSAEDPSLAGELRRMLAAERAVGDFLDLPGDESQGDATAIAMPDCIQADPHDSETAIHPGGSYELLELRGYRVLEQIGEGGMGVVYRAEQLEPIRREVAIKVIKPGMDTRQIIARFETERQTLALMDHPNIARVLDAGTTAKGLPYFVMELVDGEPITDYCDRHRLDLDSRLELFQSACVALQHAHNKGIIHRDIKPSNVLVTQVDDRPMVKVIDFGIAKALSGEFDQGTMLTGIFQVVGSPLYMSPEQASLRRLDVDTRSDVYSLGLLLYELLSGTLPIDPRSAREMSVEELRQQICDFQAPRPSRRLSQLGNECQTIAQRRGIDPAKLPQRVGGELDWIVMRAIEQDRNRRYQTPRELAEDVGHYLCGEAVLACPPSWWYRFRKAVKRYRVPVAAASLLLAGLLVGGTLAVLQAYRATRAEQLANERRDQATRSLTSLRRTLYGQDMLQATARHLDGDHAGMRSLLSDYAPREGMEDLRGFEWFLLDSIPPIRTQTLLSIPDARLNELSLAPDGETIACAGSFGNIHIGRLGSQTEFTSWHTPHGDARDVHFIDQHTLVSCGDDGQVIFWSWAGNGEEDDALQQASSIRVSQGELLTLAVSPDGRQVYTAGNDQRIYRVDRRDRSVTVISEGHGSRVETMLVLPDDRLLVGVYKRGVVAYRPESGEHPASLSDVYLIKSPLENVKDLAVDASQRVLIAHLDGSVALLKTGSSPSIALKHLFADDLHSSLLSPLGNWIAGGDASGRIHLVPTLLGHETSYLSTESSRQRREVCWQAHDAKIEDMLVIDNSTATNLTGGADSRHASVVQEQSFQIVSAARDGRIVLSSPFAERSITVRSWGVVHGLAFLDGRDVFCAGEAPSIRDVTDGFAKSVSWQLPDSWYGVQATSGTGEVFALRENLREIVRAHDWDADRPPKITSVFSVAHHESIRTWTISDDGRLLAIELKDIPSSKFRVDIHDLSVGKRIVTIPSGSCRRLQFSPDASKLAAINDNDVRILDAMSGAVIHVLRGHHDSPQGIGWLPDGRHLVSVANDRRLILWDSLTGALLDVQMAQENRASAVAIHPTLNSIATVGEDGIAYFWRVNAPAERSRLQRVGMIPLYRGNASEVSFSPDGRRLLVRHADRSVSSIESSFRGEEGARWDATNYYEKSTFELANE